MTYAELLRKTKISILASEPLALSRIPIVTGRLRSAMKIIDTVDGFEIYMDSGNMTLEEWESDPDNPSNYPMGFAPYAAKVNEKYHYWRRIADLYFMNLARDLNGEGRMISNPRGEE